MGDGYEGRKRTRGHEDGHGDGAGTDTGSGSGSGMGTMIGMGQKRERGKRRENEPSCPTMSYRGGEPKTRDGREETATGTGT